MNGFTSFLSDLSRLWYSKRAFGRLRDEFGGRHMRVWGRQEVTCHLMFGMLALMVDRCYAGCTERGYFGAVVTRYGFRYSRNLGQVCTCHTEGDRNRPRQDSRWREWPIIFKERQRKGVDLSY